MVRFCYHRQSGSLTVDLASNPTQFSHASIRKETLDEESQSNRLGFSRAYSISLAPHLIYTRSNLVPALVSSKCYRQLEFLAMGSWWIHEEDKDTQHSVIKEEEEDTVKRKQNITLQKIPGSREDVFEDKSISLRSTRSLMKILKLAADPEAYLTVIEEHGKESFSDYLTSECKIDPKLQASLLALTLSPDPPSKTTVAYALPRLHRHLTSIGIFGPGFGAVVPKWGGLAELAQVACRACAVGGGVYVLKKGIESIEQFSVENTDTEASSLQLTTVRLAGGNIVKARCIVGTVATIPTRSDTALADKRTSMLQVTHLTAIVSSPLASLFPPPAEGSPPPAAVVVVIPPSSLSLPDDVANSTVPLIYLNVHSSDTGECPEGQ
ncbi:MAG: hypothetical protein Q9218_008248, partial [Villophora microphyllina]